MARTCTICRSADRLEIEKALIVGVPYRSVARQFGAGASAVLRHKAHVGPRLARARASQDAATDRAARAEVAREDWSTESLMRQIRSLGEEVWSVLAQGKEEKDRDLILRAIARATPLLELQGKAIAAAAMQAASAGCARCSAKEPISDERLFALLGLIYARDPHAFLETLRQAAAERYASRHSVSTVEARLCLEALEKAPVDSAVVGGSGRLLSAHGVEAGGNGQ
jgi:hypothetical protein